MLRDYRDWLESELNLLGNASHHAYSFGQANMAKRAMDRLDEELSATVFVPLTREVATSVSSALEQLAQTSTALDPALSTLRDAITVAIASDTPPPKA